MDQAGQSDWVWVQRVQAGETEAFEVLIHRHEKRLFNLLYRWLGDYEEAAEAAQEVFLSAFRSIRSFRGEALFSTWLYRIAVRQAQNRSLRLQRARQRSVPLGDPDPGRDGDPTSSLVDPEPNQAEEAEQKEIRSRVHEALRSLQPDEALVIILHDLQEVSYEEMATMLEIPLGTVKSRLHRARRALKAQLTPHFSPKATG